MGFFDTLGVMLNSAAESGFETWMRNYKQKLRNDSDSQVQAKWDEVSNVDFVSRKISQDIVSKYSEYLESDIKQSYYDFKADAERFFYELRTSNQELIETADKNIEEIKAKYEETEKEVQEINKYKKQLTDMLELVRKDIERRVAVPCE